MQTRYVLADFELSYFFSKIKTGWNFWILFLKTIHQKGLFEQIKKKLNFCFCRRILENYWQPLLTNLLKVRLFKAMAI